MYRITYTYSDPSRAGPFRGSMTVTEPYAKGDMVFAPFGRAIVVSCRRINT